MALVKTNKTWRNHMPHRPRRRATAYYNQEKIPRQKIIVRIIWIIFFVILAQGIFQSRHLAVDRINVKGNDNFSSQEISLALEEELTAKVFFVFKKSNYFLLKTEELEEFLSAQYNFESVKVAKKFPKTLLVEVKEKISHFIWQKDDTLYLIDSKGALNGQTGAQNEESEFLFLDDQRSVQIESDQVFTQTEIDKLNTLYFSWEEIIDPSLKIDRIVIRDNWELELIVSLGFYIKMDAQEDVENQILNLDRVLTGGITDSEIDYIDLRFGDRVYFK